MHHVFSLMFMAIYAVQTKATGRLSFWTSLMSPFSIILRIPENRDQGVVTTSLADR